MLLNRLWIGLFVVSFVVGLSKLIGWGDGEVFFNMVTAMFDSAKTSFELALYLTGALCLWMGFMEIGEKGGAVAHLTRWVSPLFSKLFPEVPDKHPAIGAMMMNFSANMLGLDNAATPLGLKAMNQLQELNPNKEEASNAQIMFIVLNASGLTIIPVSILAYRAAAGSENASVVFLPILIATFFSTLGGLTYVAIKQRINLLQPVIISYIGTALACVLGLLFFLSYHPEYTESVSKIGGNLLLFLVVMSFIYLGIRSKINIYEAFIDGAKGGFDVAVKIIPFLVAILVAVGVFKASGAMDALFEGVKSFAVYLGATSTAFIDALPTAFMKPFSGGAARGMMIEVFNNPALGPDSFAGKLASTFQGSTETTFYVLAVYFGSVGVKKTRYAAAGGLVADLFGFIAAIFVAYLFYQ